ncbi:MAG: hydroxyisourate hydrolase [Candidatus Eiseniibacteriota bacterium]
MSAITTHVLDTSIGRPAAGVAVVLERFEDGAWKQIASGTTDADGRLRQLLPAGIGAVAGVHALVFETEAYFREQGRECFYPRARVEFHVAAGEDHLHVPLLLSPFGYSTYRGS